MVSMARMEAVREIAFAMTASSEPGSRADRAVRLESLLDAFERPVLRLCYRLLGNLPDAEDAAQEVFLRAYRNLGMLSGIPDPLPWLYRVAVNLCRDRHRRARPSLGLDQVPELQARAASPEDEAARAERKQIVVDGLAVLPEREREAVVLRELEGLETRQVAAIMEIAEESVRSLCSLGRAKLRQYVEGRMTR